VPLAGAPFQARAQAAWRSFGIQAAVWAMSSPAASASTASAWAASQAWAALTLSGPMAAAWRSRKRPSWNWRPLAPNRTSWATVGQGIQLAGSPRYSRRSSGSGSWTPDMTWLVAKPSMALATGMRLSALVR